MHRDLAILRGKVVFVAEMRGPGPILKYFLPAADMWSEKLHSTKGPDNESSFDWRDDLGGALGLRLL
jgi:hypothetical protein